jgi:GNAT superfamily N-acetyltransferase
MLDVTRTIWDGNDYVPEAWPDWLSDPIGRLIVAEHEGRIVGLTRIGRLSPGAWWLQGLRVHPDFEGRGVASQLHQAAVNTWREIGDGTLRLSTASFRYPVHHLCERSGFVKVGERTVFVALDPLEAGSVDAPEASPFQPILTAEIPEAVEFIRCSPAFRLQDGLLELDWEYALVHETFLIKGIERGMAWWWRGREGALLAYESTDDDRPTLPFITALACQTGDMSALLADFRRQARRLGYAGIGWVAPLRPEILRLLDEHGFERRWEHSIFVYALEKTVV